MRLKSSHQQNAGFMVNGSVLLFFSIVKEHLCQKYNQLGQKEAFCYSQKCETFITQKKTLPPVAFSSKHFL